MNDEQNLPENKTTSLADVKQKVMDKLKPKAVVTISSNKINPKAIPGVHALVDSKKKALSSAQD